YFSCNGPGQCEAIPSACCPMCRQLQLADFIGVNSSLASAYEKDHCSDNAGCPAVGCATLPNDNIGAYCNQGTCNVFDVTQPPEFSGCETDSDCVLRHGLGCCECGGGGDWVAVSVKGRATLTSVECGANTACDECAPAPPPGEQAFCLQNVCTIVRPL